MMHMHQLAPKIFGQATIKPLRTIHTFIQLIKLGMNLNQHKLSKKFNIK